jgi:hypothetical protein
VNSLFRLDAASWSPVESFVGESESAKPRGPSLLAAVAVIAVVAALTAGGVAAFFGEASQAASDEKTAVIEAQAPVEVASLETILPVRKVTTQTFKQSPAAEPHDAAVSEMALAEPELAAESVDAEIPEQPVDALTEQDPRWAAPDGDKSSAAFTSMLQPSEAAPGVVASGTIPLEDGATQPDETRTAAIEPEEVNPKRTAKPKRTASAKAPDDDAGSPPGFKQPFDVSSSKTVQIAKGVNMRSRPKSGSSVLGVIPKGASVQVLEGCKSWCEVVYKGRRGYIFRDFVGGSSSAGKQKAAKNNDKKTIWTTAKAETEATDEAKPSKVTQTSSR